MALHDLGRVEEAHTAFANQIVNFGESEPMELAMAYAWVGDADQAFEWLDRAGGPDSRGQSHVLNPIWRNLHDDPRWEKLRNQTGLTEERIAALDFNPALPD